MTTMTDVNSPWLFIEASKTRRRHTWLINSHAFKFLGILTNAPASRDCTRCRVNLLSRCGAQSPDKIKRYEFRARRRILSGLDPLLSAFVLNKNNNKTQNKNKNWNISTQRFNSVGRLIAMPKQQTAKKKTTADYPEDFPARLVR